MDDIKLFTVLERIANRLDEITDQLDVLEKYETILRDIQSQVSYTELNTSNIGKHADELGKKLDKIITLINNK